MDRSEVLLLREKLQGILNTVSLSLGYKLTLGRCSYDTVATFKLEAAPIKKDGTAETKESADFRRYCGIYHLRPSDLGRKFRWGNNQYTVTGFLSRARRNKILATRQDGRKFKFSDTFVKAELDGPAKKECKNSSSPGQFLDLATSNVLYDWIQENARKVEDENPWLPSDWSERLLSGKAPKAGLLVRTSMDQRKILDTTFLAFYLPKAEDIPL